MSYSRKSLRELDKQSIRDFVAKYRDLLGERVLDYGCGDKPYKNLIGEGYVGYDIKFDDPLPEIPFDGILCTQVIQEADDPQGMMLEIYDLLKPGGYVVMTFNPAWEEYGYPDRWRFTKEGIEELAENIGFSVVVSELRYGIPFEDFTLQVGRGIVLKK